MLSLFLFFFFKQKTAYEMRISDWSSDVCSSDLPADVREILTLGLAGIALSRYAGVWVAMKTIAEVVESAASFDLPDPFPAFQATAQFVPAHGLNWDPSIQWPAQRAESERRMVEERLPAVAGWAPANRIDTPP